mgnify:CR=1 FL=1
MDKPVVRISARKSGGVYIKEAGIFDNRGRIF